MVSIAITYDVAVVVLITLNWANLINTEFSFICHNISVRMYLYLAVCDNSVLLSVVLATW